MRKINFILPLAFVISLVLLARIKCNPNKPYYEPGQYALTVKEKIYGVATRTVEGKNFFGVVIDKNEKTIYPFTCIIEKMPDDWQKKYPKDFIQVGDTILKKAENDTFFVIRKNEKWMYVLPNVIARN